MSYILDKYLESNSVFNRWFSTQLNRRTAPTQYSAEDFKVKPHSVLTTTKVVSFSESLWNEFAAYLESKESTQKEALLENLFSSIWCLGALTQEGWATELTVEQAFWLKDYCKKNYSHKKDDWLYWALPLTATVSTEAVNEHPLVVENAEKLEKLTKKIANVVLPQKMAHTARLVGIHSLLNNASLLTDSLQFESTAVIAAEHLETILPLLKADKLNAKLTGEFFTDTLVSLETAVIRQVLKMTGEKTEEEVLALLNKAPGSIYSVDFVKAWVALSEVFASPEFDPEKLESAVTAYSAVVDQQAVSSFWAKDPSALMGYKWRTDMNALHQEWYQIYRRTQKSFGETVKPLIEKALQKIGVNSSLSSTAISRRVNLFQIYDEALHTQVINQALLRGSVKWIVFEEISNNLAAFEEKMKDIFAEKQESFKIGFMILLCEQIAKNLAVTLEEVTQQATERVRGWYDLSKVLTPAGQWVLIEYRKTEKELTLSKFVNHYLPIVRREEHYVEDSGASMVTTADSPFMVYRPFDPRGGFVVNTYLAICEKYAIDPWPSAEDMHKFWTSCHSSTIASARIAAMHLTYLYGMDVEAIDKKITDLAQAELDSAKKKRTAVYNAAKSLPGMIPAVDAEVMRTWRPVLIKYPKVLKYASNLTKVAPLTTTEEITETQAIGLMIQHHYTGVPEHLASHMLHALENHWDQSVVDHFVELNDEAKTECYIPNIKFEKNGVKVYCLEPGDATALYIGELSGCCQHINDGGGDDAAIQSFTEPWCSVLMIESANSGTLLAQSFLWTCQDKKYVVMDSVESVLETTNQSVRNLVYPALCTWIKKMKEAGFKVAISDATYGLTDTLRELFEEDENVRVEAIPAPESYDSLDYTDVSSEVYKLKVVS